LKLHSVMACRVYSCWQPPWGERLSRFGPGDSRDA